MEKRSRMSLGRRFDSIAAEARMLAEAAASKVGFTSPSADEEDLRGTAGMLLEPGTDSAYGTYVRRFRILIEALESEVDAQKFGLSIVGVDPMSQSKEERDKRLIKWTREGLTPEEIHFLDEGQGSVRTIQKQLERLRDDEAL
jgi:DNA-binding LacI/PurR family transcriptional regulator